MNCRLNCHPIRGVAGVLLLAILLLPAFVSTAEAAYSRSTQSNWTGKPICGGENLQTGKMMPPCGLTRAKFVRRANQKCPQGSFFDLGTWACYACPTGFNRTANEISGPAACSKRVRKEMAPAKRKGRYNKCPKNSFFDPRNSGECWRCPPGYGRTAVAVTEWNACGKVMAKARSAELVATVCPKGSFADGRNGGECWQCPEGFVRSSAAVTGLNACYRDEMLKPANQVESGICPKDTFFDPIDKGSCWSCPKDSVRTVFSVKGKTACEYSEIRWDPATRDAKSLFHIPGGVGVARALISSRTEIDNASRKLAKMAEVDEEAFLSLQWEYIKTRPQFSLALNAAVFNRLIEVIKTGPKTEDERKLRDYFAKYVQDTRMLVAIQIRDVYESFKRANTERRTRSGSKIANMYSVGFKPPDLNKIAQGALGVTGGLMINAGIAMAHFTDLAAAKKTALVPLLKAIFPHGTSISVAKSELVAGKGIIAALGINLKVLAVIGGPIFVTVGAAIVAALAIDVMMETEKAEAKIADALMIAQRPVNLGHLLLSDKGEKELTGNWGSMTRAMRAPSVPLLLPGQSASHAPQGSGNVIIRDGGTLVVAGAARPDENLTQSRYPVETVNWTAVDGKANHVSVAADGVAWLITKRRATGGFAIVNRDRQRWRQVPGGGRYIAASGVAPLVVDKDGGLAYFQSAQWHTMEAPASVTSIGANGQVIGIVGTRRAQGGKEVYVFSNNKWTRQSAGAEQIAVSNEAIWIVNNQGELYSRRLRDSRWISASAPKASAIAAGGGDIWIIGAGGDSGKLFRRAAGRSWVEVNSPGRPFAIAAHDDGSVWLILRNGKIFRTNVN